MRENRLWESYLAPLRQVIRRELGLDIAPQSISSFADKIVEAAKDLGYADPQECVHSLTTRKLGKREIEVLASHLTVGETYFFRDGKAFAMLENHLLPRLIRQRRQTRTLRLWSAACATGEEPYSLAMLLMKILPDWQEWHITILATDINTRFLGKAIKGRYTDWSFRTTPNWARQRFFSASSATTYDLDPLVRRMVTFSYLNLAENVYPSLRNNTNAMDVILCRNALIYFGQEMRRHVVAGMHRALVDGGCLLVSPVESSRQLFEAFEHRSVEGVSLYFRSGEGLRSDAAVAEPHAAERAAPAPPRKPLPQATPRQVQTPPPVRKPDEKQQAAAAVVPPAQTDGSFHHADYLFKTGQYAEAAAELYRCPTEARTQLLLARVHANLGDFKQARDWCGKAIVSSPLDPHARYLLAMILQEQGMAEEAIAALRHTIYLDQHFILAQYSLASLLARSDRKEQARKHFDNAYRMARRLPEEQVVPESDGLPAGRLAELIFLSMQAEYEE